MICMKVLSRIFHLSAFAGFLYHLFVLSASYFRYSTQTDYLIEPNFEGSSVDNEVPSLAICISYTDILDYDRLQKLLGEPVTRTNNFLGKANIHARLTLRQIFDLTPTANSTISRCFYRNDDGFILNLHSRDLCQEIFLVERFYQYHSMCYIFKPNPAFTFSLPVARYTLISPSVFYGVKLSEEFRGMNFFKSMIYYSDGDLRYPYVSISYAHSNNRMSNFAKKIAHFRAITFTYAWIGNELLPLPYDTACIQKEECMHRCWDKMEQQLGKVFYMRIIPEHMLDQLDKKHVNYYDLRNDSTRELIVHEMERCSQLCYGSWCKYTFTITEMDASRTAHDPDEPLSIYVKSEMKPGTLAHAAPKLNFMTFLIYVSSCLEIWLGVRVLTFSKLYKKLENRIRRGYKLMRAKKRRRIRRMRRRN